MKIEISNVIDYKDALFRKLEEEIKLMDRGFDIPEKLTRQINLLTLWTIEGDGNKLSDYF